MPERRDSHRGCVVERQGRRKIEAGDYILSGIVLGQALHRQRLGRSAADIRLG